MEVIEFLWGLWSGLTFDQRAKLSFSPVYLHLPLSLKKHYSMVARGVGYAPLSTNHRARHISASDDIFKKAFCIIMRPLQAWLSRLTIHINTWDGSWWCQVGFAIACGWGSSTIPPFWAGSPVLVIQCQLLELSLRFPIWWSIFEALWCASSKTTTFRTLQFTDTPTFISFHKFSFHIIAWKVFCPCHKSQSSFE